MATITEALRANAKNVEKIFMLSWQKNNRRVGQLVKRVVVIGHEKRQMLKVYRISVLNGNGPNKFKKTNKQDSDV